MWWTLIVCFVLFMLFKLLFLHNISINDAAEKLKNGAVLIDVRTPGEFSSGAHSGAVNISVDELSKISGAVKDKNKPILLYCHSGARAAAACAKLRGMGYSDVSNVGGFHRAAKLFEGN